MKLDNGVVKLHNGGMSTTETVDIRWDGGDIHHGCEVIYDLRSSRGLIKVRFPDGTERIVSADRIVGPVVPIIR